MTDSAAACRGIQRQSAAPLTATAAAQVRSAPLREAPLAACSAALTQAVLLDLQCIHPFVPCLPPAQAAASAGGPAAGEAPRPPTVIVAFGGNALLKRGEPLTLEVQQRKCVGGQEARGKWHGPSQRAAHLLAR